MARNRLVSLALAAALALQPALASAQDCASQVQSAEEQARQQFIQGMAGLANNNFSLRPGTMSSMACLDKFMSGNMDTLFRPPQLNDLLGQVLNFACQKATQAMSSSGMGAGGATNLQSIIGSLSGGLNIPGMGGGGGGGLMNLSSMLGAGGGGGGFSSGTGSIGNLFAGRR